MGLLDNLFDTSQEAQLAAGLGITKEFITETFEEFDADKNGTLDIQEMKNFAESLGVCVTMG